MGTRLNRKSDATQVNSTFIANPTTVIDVRWGFNRFPNLYRTVSAGFDPASLGFGGNWLRDIQYLKFPRFDNSLFAPLGAENDAQWAVYHSRNLLANVSKLVSRHSLKAGFAYRQIEIVNQPFGYSAGQFSFTDTFTRADYRAFDGRTGSPMADLLLGFPGSGTAQTSTKFFQYVKYWAGYFQDNFRVSPKLTLNLGLRYEWEPGMADRNNALIVGFDRSAAHPIGQNTKGALMYAGVDGNPTSVLNPSKAKFAPRIGAAWAMNDKTTIRAGYGLYWAPPSYAGFNTLGYTQISQFLGTIDGGRTPNGSLANPFPSGLVKPVGNADGKNAGTGQSISFPDQFATSPRMHQFSFDVQRILPGQLVLTAGYVGSRSRKFLLGTGSVNINQLTADQARLGQSLFDLVDNPYYNKGGVGIIAPAQLQRAQLLRPFPQFGAVGLTFGDYNHARYDSLAVKVEKRMSRGVSFISSWTWARNRDMAVGPPNNQNGGAGAPQNAYDLESEYSLSLLDIQHRVTAAVNYELPFGRGRSWLGSNRILDLAVGGWEVNMVAYFQTGFPLPIVQPNQNGILGAGVQRPNLSGKSFNSVASDKLDQWINPAAFAVAPAYTFGNAPRTVAYRMPGQDNVDFSLFKTFTIYERLKAQFRAEALNALNTPMFGRPDTTFNTANFGKVTNQRNFPRTVQLGIRVFF
ncbi:MAG: TonB-dependent receptor [Bryobacterales bacterium]|nr:TonB-dependent receptor [Bryobacterales bacterium]